MKKALLLHWWGSNSDDNWLPWLQKELNSRFFDVYTPNLPNTEKPILKEQEEYINIYSSDFNKWWYIIWHSLWCQLALNFIEENNIKNSIIILVAPTYPWLVLELWKKVLGDSYETIEKYYNTKINFEKVNKLNNKVIVFLSDNDPYINMKNAKKYYSKLKNIEFKEFKGKWHFNKNAWVLKLEEILNYIK